MSWASGEVTSRFPRVSGDEPPHGAPPGTSVGFPRVSGDEPVRRRRYPVGLEFSPRERG